MKRIITIILVCLPFVAFGQTDYVDRLMKTDEYGIMGNEIIYKEPLEFNTLDEVFEFINNSPKKEKAKIIEDEELGIVSYKTLDVVRIVRVYGMIFKASYNYNGIIELTYRAVVEEAREAYKAATSANVEEARAAYKAATSVNPAKEHLRYARPTEEELRAILKAVKEDYAPNSEIKKTTIGGEVRKTIGGEVRKTIVIVDTYQIGNYKIEVAKSDGIDLINIHNIPDRI